MRSSIIFLMLAVLGLTGVGCAGSAAKVAPVDRTRFLEHVFQGKAPEADYIWLTPDLRNRIAAALGQSNRGARVPYWQKNGKTLWIFEGTAKEASVCVGVVIAGGSIVHLEILSAAGRYGAAVGNDAFTRQFRRASLKAGDQLDQPIDAVSGATLSSNTVSAMARLALILDAMADAS